MNAERILKIIKADLAYTSKIHVEMAKIANKDASMEGPEKYWAARQDALSALLKTIEADGEAGVGGAK